jgi:hypothetical protein
MVTAATLRAAFVYFLILFVIRLVGNVLRVYLLAPMIGHTMTALLEVPVLLLVAWVASRALINRFGMRRRLSHAALMGVVTLGLLIAAEALLSTSLGDSLDQFLRAFGRAPGGLGLLSAIILSFFPAIQVALARSRHR